MPAIFLGHGNPMNAVSNNRYTDGWRRIGMDLPRPRAVLAISAHWFVPELAVTGSVAPRTIHDFGGFPRALYEVRYPAPGQPELARRVQDLLKPAEVRLDDSRGFDHGIWSVLRHVYPDASVPVVQLSIDERHSGSFHFEVGHKLAALRDEDVLLLGSGNLVHNLHTYAWGRHSQEPYDWALRFEQKARALMRSGDHLPLVDYPTLGPDAALSVPTPEHYLPLMYVLATRHTGEEIAFPIEGIDGGSVSMLAVRVG
jgi:4,5-DOPA dioxygenase extradiol